MRVEKREGAASRRRKNANDDDKSQGRDGNKQAQEPINNGRDNNDATGRTAPQSVGGNTPQGDPSGSGNDTPQSETDRSPDQQSAGGLVAVEEARLATKR